MRLPGMAIAHEIGERIICAARLSHGCRSDPELAATYGELAERIRENAPTLVYEPGMTALPVDFRHCRSPRCSDGPGEGRVARSQSGVATTLFTHVVDCRDSASAAEHGYDCSGERAGRVYVQYWTYYGDSATSRSLYGSAGYHRDDWESYQVRIDPDGSTWARASSHNGYNGSDNPAIDWTSDAAGKVPAAEDLRDLSENAGLRDLRGWTPADGRLYVSGGSHAGHASETSLRRELSRLLATGAGDRYERLRTAGEIERTLFGPGRRTTPRGSLSLVPLEHLAGRDGYSFAISPPWRKRVWSDPEYEGTN